MELVYKKSRSHTTNLLSNLKSNGDFCDIRIKCGDYQVMAHKCVLAASTEYFRRMLSDDTHEAETGIIDLSAIHPDVVKELVDFIYLGSVRLSMATVKGLMDTGSVMRLPDLFDLSVEFMLENIDLNNFSEVIDRCLFHNNKTQINKPLGKFLHANLEEVVKSEDFKWFEHEKVDYCYQLLQGISRKTEELKWYGLMVWTNEDLEERETVFHDLFQSIELKRLSREFIKKHIASENIIDGCMMSLKYVRRFCIGKLPKVQERITSPSHITSINKSSRLVYQYDLSDEEWTVVDELPSAIHLHQSVAEYNGILYVGDGMSLHSFSDAGWKCLHRTAKDRLSISHYSRVACAGRWVIMITVSHTVMFDIFSHRVHELHHLSMTVFTEGFFLLGFDTTVYLLGGVARTGAVGDSKTVAKFKSMEKRYGAVASMVMGRAYGAAIQYKGFLYAMGGYSRTVEFHNTWTRQWQILSGFEIQCRNATVYLADKLYIFGGELGTEVKTFELCRLEITAKDLRPTRRSAGDMEACCASYIKYIKLSR